MIWIYVLIVLLYLTPASFGNDVIIANIGDETLFEGRPLILRCQSQLQPLSWWKGSSKMAEYNNKILTVDPLYQHLDFSHHFTFLVITFTNLTVADSDTYTCRGNSEGVTANDTVRVNVYQNGQCVTNYNGPLEYLTSNMTKTLFVKCNYPMATSRGFTSTWYDMNSIELNTISSSKTDYTYTTTSVYSIPKGQNGSILTCYVKEADDPLPGPLSSIFSCSVGPIYFYEFPYLLIEALNSSVIYEMEAITLSCRLVPSSIITELIWIVPGRAEHFEIMKSGGISFLTLSSFDLGMQGELTVEVTCNTAAVGQTYLSTHSFIVRKMVTTNIATEITSPKAITMMKLPQSPEFENDASNGSKNQPMEHETTPLILIIVILSVVVVVLLAVLFQIVIWLVVRKRDPSRKSTDVGSSKRSSIYTNEGFNKDGIYNDRASAQMSPKPNLIPSERCVEINDDEESSDETLQGNPNLQFKRPSSVSTFSDVSSLTSSSQYKPPSYTSVVRNESAYDLPPTSPIYATISKKKRTRSHSSNSNTQAISSVSSQLSQQGNSSMDDDSGVSLSFQKSFGDHVEFTEGPILSTKC